MAIKSKLMALAVAGGLFTGINSVQANLEISAGVRIGAVADFEAPLGAEGGWVEVRGYGRCWHPSRVAIDWRPYCEGQWVWTDNGWYWESDEPWAWACYHYGTWTLDPALGWVWVPGVEWAPAWVVWRSGGGYVGWAPCAPHGVVIAPERFAFVQESRLNERVHSAAIVAHNDEVYRKTKVLKQASRETRNIGGKSEKVVINRGPGVTTVQKAAGHEIKVAPVQEVHARTHFPDAMVHRTAAPAPTPHPEVRPGPAGHEEPRPPVHIEPAHEQPAQHDHPAEGPKGHDEGRRDPKE